MRLLTLLKATLLSLSLSACVAPLLAMGPGQLMWALLKPMVGLDPNATNLFEQPVIKTRMTGLLGPHYDTTVGLLRTASELQQEGPLFYLMSRTPGQELADKAGLVWNADTNQMAVLLNTDNQTRVFSESHTGRAAVWPQAMQGWLTQAAPPTPAALPAVPVAEPAPAAPQAQPLQEELEATRARLAEAEQKLKALEQPAPTPAPAGSLSGDAAEAAMEALLGTP
ncbi:hypothetical protein [Zobellella taiwanensis]